MKWGGIDGGRVVWQVPLSTARLSSSSRQRDRAIHLRLPNYGAETDLTNTG